MLGDVRLPLVALPIVASLLSASCGTEELEPPERARPSSNFRPPRTPGGPVPTASPTPEPPGSPTPEPQDTPEPEPTPTSCPKRLVSGHSLTGTGRAQTFGASSARQRFVVPEGVTSLAVKLWGAGGGTCGPRGGAGGYVSVPSLPVMPGETIEVIVGGGGVCRAVESPGGFGGGGRGSDNRVYAWSGSGGGRSAILRGGDDIVTAGGGGGAGYPAIASENNRPNDPAGGGCAGPCGAGGDSPSRGGGQGGQLHRGGSPGISLTDGKSGGAREGGHGLSMTEGFVTSGGGGGGYFGGGSGGHEAHVTSGGGGGGSCHVPLGGSYDAARDAAPGGVSDPDYADGAGRGGDALELDGRPGRVVIGW